MTKLNITPDWADTPLLDIIDDPERAQDNRALIRAAPELYRALSEGVSLVADQMRRLGVLKLEAWLDEARASLAKARGEG